MSVDDLPAALLIRASFLLGTLHRRSLELESEELGRMDVGVKEHAALSVLADEGPMTQQHLCGRLGIDRTTIVYIVDGLEPKGLIERRRDPADRRAYLLTLTKKGRRVESRGRALFEKATDRLLSALDAPDRRRLLDLLGRALQPADDRL